MGAWLTEDQKATLTAALKRGASDASGALSRWLGREVALEVSEVEEVELEEVAGQLGPEDSLVACCAMDLSGKLTGQLLMVFEDRSGMALTDMLLGRPQGTSTDWGELEQSAAKETANIVGCAYLNSLAAHLDLDGSASPPSAAGGAWVPSPPEFRHEFAASLLEFALMDQATEADRLLFIMSRFGSEADGLRWLLLFVPSGEALRTLSESLPPRP